MIVSKKLLHLLNLLKIQQNIKSVLSYCLFYNLKKLLFLVVIVFFFDMLLKKKIIPFYFYLFEVKLPNYILFNSILFKVFSMLRVIDSILYFQLNYIKVLKDNYTVLRSPFINKKSRDQLSFDQLKGFFFFNLGIKNIFIIEYLDYFFINLLKISTVVSIVLKKLIYLK